MRHARELNVAIYSFREPKIFIAMRGRVKRMAAHPALSLTIPKDIPPRPRQRVRHYPGGAHEDEIQGSLV